jgi:hypothetical protein
MAGMKLHEYFTNRKFVSCSRRHPEVFNLYSPSGVQGHAESADFSILNNYGIILQFPDGYSVDKLVLQSIVTSRVPATGLVRAQFSLESIWNGPGS